jgi:uncharacterized protein
VLSAQCRACPVVRVCGGGLYAHRYRASNGFDNPSVYCADLKALVDEVTAPRADPADHRLPPGAFDAFAAGPGDAAGMAALAAVRLSLTRALVAGVAGEPGRGDRELAGVARAGWELLAELDARHPDAVAETLSHPYAQAWAARCLRPPPGSDPDLDRAHLAGLAAAAALRARWPVELPLPVRDGFAHLPGVGALRADPGDGRSVVVSIGASGRVTVPGRDAEWSPVRRLDGADLAVAVEDLDPFRDCQDWPPSGRLPGPEWDTWRRALAAAGHELAERVPRYASVLRAGLRAVVPLRPGDTGNGRSATARHAFGGVGVALPGDLAELLVHEFQHVKLNALMDLYRLADPADGVLLTVPWRPDPRPVEGALHGVYAHLAVAALWRARAHHDPRAAPRFRRYRGWIDPVVDALVASGALTADGERFTAGMRRTVDGWAGDR